LVPGAGLEAGSMFLLFLKTVCGARRRVGAFSVLVLLRVLAHPNFSNQ
jgi:hypothetical protein